MRALAIGLGVATVLLLVSGGHLISSRCCSSRSAS
jgi:hypothetical protein